MKKIVHPVYFPNIATFATIVQNEIIWETSDNYQKQTYRNRCYICNDLGKHLLTIPIQHIGGQQGHQKYKDVRLANDYKWQRQHWRTLQTAYRTSPFFEYYEDEIAPLFTQEYDFLMDFNLKTIATLCQCLQIDMSEEKTIAYTMQSDQYSDARLLVNAKIKIPLQQAKYVQVFGDRHGFIKNTSVLDLLFNEGPSAMAYLKNLSLDFIDA